MSDEPTEVSEELIALTEELLASIVDADWETYERLCDPTLTAFEPESCGHLVDGMEFHRFYFDLGSSETPRQTSLINPHIRMLSRDAAIVCYTRLVQNLDANGAPISLTFEETRVWQRQEGQWQHVHFHRSERS